MNSNQKKTRDPDEWIGEHKPDWQERRCIARAILTSSEERTVSSGAFCVSRYGERITVHGTCSTLIVDRWQELDKIMAAIAWADAIEQYLAPVSYEWTEPEDPIGSVERMVLDQVVGRVLANRRKGPS
jgi:hypothetical protein